MVVGVMANGEHLRRDALRTVAKAVTETARARLAELAAEGGGCETAAARAYQHGRLQVVEVDMWEALGFTPPGPPPLVATTDGVPA